MFCAETLNYGIQQGALRVTGGQVAFDSATALTAVAAAKSLGTFSPGEANSYFATTLALWQRDPAGAV